MQSCIFPPTHRLSEIEETDMDESVGSGRWGKVAHILDGVVIIKTTRREVKVLTVRL